MINVYSIIPFMEFALMAKIKVDLIAPFVGFYEEIKEYLLANMDSTQEELFNVYATLTGVTGNAARLANSNTSST